MNKIRLILRLIFYIRVLNNYKNYSKDRENAGFCGLFIKMGYSISDAPELITEFRENFHRDYKTYYVDGASIYWFDCNNRFCNYNRVLLIKNIISKLIKEIFK